METIHVILLYQSITSFNIFQVTYKFTLFYIRTVHLDAIKSPLPNGATYTHQQGHYQYKQLCVHCTHTAHNTVKSMVLGMQ